MAEANLKLLGSAIRSFREQAQPRVSQFRLATMMNWEGTAPIVEIEKGRRHPRPETLNAIGDALQLSPADIAYLHGLAGYRAVTVMPTLEQIKRVLRMIEPDIAQLRYPVYVMDYQFRFWMINSAAARQGGTLEHLHQIMQQGFDGLQMSFDSRIFPRSDDPETEIMERETIFRFKAYNLYRRHEPFYLAYPDCMRERLLPDDYAYFAKCWHAVDVRMQDVYPITPQVFEPTEAGVMTFNVHMVEIPHLDRLLFVAYYEPRDDSAGNRDRCEAFFPTDVPAGKSCICAWDFKPPG